MGEVKMEVLNASKIEQLLLEIRFRFLAESWNPAFEERLHVNGNMFKV